MYDQTDEREWILSAKGNHCCKVDDNLVATVFENDYGSWQIIINGDPHGQLVKDEYFKTAEEGVHRAEDILDGAEYDFMVLKPRP